MPKKELSTKTRVWERDRRERLNISFSDLGSLLPNYDPGVTLSKVEILQKAANYIRELQQENRNLLQGNVDEFTSKQVQQLKQRIDELLKRVQQLVNLLRDAGISVPSHLAMESSRPLPWSNKFKLEDVALPLEKAKKKKMDPKISKIEPKKKKKLNRIQLSRTNATPLKPVINNTSKVTPAKHIKPVALISRIPSSPSKKSTACKKPKDQNKSGKSTKLFGDKLPTVAQLLGLTMNDIDTSPAAYVDSATISVHETTTAASSTLINTSAPLPPGFIVIQGNNGVQQTAINSTSVLNQHRAQPCIMMPTQTIRKKVTKSCPVPQPISLVLSNSTSNNIRVNKRKPNNLIAVTKSHLLTAPVIATGIQTCPPPAVLTNHSPGLAGLGPGTLILANGNIVPVLPPTPTVLTATPTQFIVNSNQLPAPANPAPVIMMQQRKNAVTITTSSNGTALVTTSSSKPQQRSFPVLVPKKSEAADSTVTTFSNKVPIPALTSRHQPVKCQQGQAPLTTIAAKSPGKAKSKSDSEGIKPVNTVSGSSNKIPCSVSKKSSVSRGKEKSIKSASEKEDNGLDSSNENASITDVNIKKDGGLQKERNADNKITSEVSNNNDNENSKAKQSLKVDNVLDVANEDVKEGGTIEVNNQDTQVEDENKEEEIRSPVVKEVPPTTKRRKKSEEEDSEEIGNKKKRIKCDVVNHNAKTDNTDIDNPHTNIVCSTLPESTLKTSLATLKSANTGAYTIDALCVTEPAKCLDGNSSQDPNSTDDSIVLKYCDKQVVSAEGKNEEIKTKQETVKVTYSCVAKDVNEIVEISSKDNQVISNTISECNASSDSNINRSDTSLNDTTPTSEAEIMARSPTPPPPPPPSSSSSSSSSPSLSSSSLGVQEADKSSIDECSNITTSNSSGILQENNADNSQVSQQPENHNSSELSESIENLKVTNLCTDVELTTKSLQNNTTDHPIQLVSLQSKQDAENVDREILGIPQKSVQMTSSPWQEDKENTIKDNTCAKYQLLPVTDNISASMLPQQQQQQQHELVKEINVINAKEHGLCNESSIGTCPSVPDHQKSTTSTEMSTDKSLQPNSLYSMTTAIATHCSENTFIPITNSSTEGDAKIDDNETNVNNSLSISLQNSEFSGDLFASLQVPSSGQHAESISPTAAFLLAFPLVSSSKVTEMMGDSQEEVGSDSMQGSSTLLQIGSIEPEHLSKSHQSDDANVTATSSETTTTKSPLKITSISSLESVSDKGYARELESGQSINRDQNEIVCSSQEKRTEITTQNSEQCSSTTSSLHLANFPRNSGKQWTDDNDEVEPHDKVNSRSRSIGTQANSFNNLEHKSAEANCVQNSMSITIKTCLPVDTSEYNILQNDRKVNANTSCYSQQMETGTSTVSTNNAQNQPVSSSHSHITIFKSGQQHQECHVSSQLFQPSLPMFESVTMKNTVSGDSAKKLNIDIHKFPSSVVQPIEELCMKPQMSVSAQCNATHTTTNFTQTFLTNKETNNICENVLSHTLTPGNTATTHRATQNSFTKIHPTQNTVTEEPQNVNISYKSLATSASAVSTAGDIAKHSFSNQVSTNSVPPASQPSRSAHYNNVSSSVPPQPYSYNLFNNDYSALHSQPMYTQASSSNDQTKAAGAASFSVAHNSSNFSILSWTTLSPMSASTNVNQCENFSAPSQNTSVNMPQRASSSASLQKSVPQTDMNVSNNTTAILPASTASEMQGLAHNSNCQKQCKGDGNIGKSMNDGVRKLTGSFQGLYSSENQRSLGVPQRDNTTSHLQFHHTNNENHVSGSQDEGGNNENFKYPGSSNAEVKTRQTRTNHSTDRIKASQQHRPPVNWMTTPDIRTSCSSSSSASVCQTVIRNVPVTATSVMNSETNPVQVNKEFEFCSTTSNHNLFMSNSNVTPPTYDSRSFAGNAPLYGSHVLPSHSSLYSNNRQTSHLTCSKEETINSGRNVHHNPAHQRLTDLPVPGQNYNEAYSISWTPRKVPFTSSSMMPPDMSSNNFVPSTLPTLVGDLALGTNYPMSGNDDNGHTKPYMHSSFGDSEINKKNTSVVSLDDRRQDVSSGKQIQSRHNEKESGISNGNVGNKTRNNNNSSSSRVCTQEYRNNAHSEGGTSGGSAGASGNFLSVSQLVDQVKSGAGSSRTQVSATARRSSNNRQVNGGNKHNTVQQRQHATASNVGPSAKRTAGTQNASERDGNKKQQQQQISMSFSIAENTNTMAISGDNNRKPNEGSRESHYASENNSTLIPPISQSNAGFPMPVHDIASHPPSSVTNTHHHWSPSRGKPGRTGTTAYKAPVSSYSAEALIGLSSNTQNNSDTTHLPQEPTNNKVISLPPPMVSERFCHNQNYHHHPQSARPLQMSSSFGNEGILPGNYFPPVDLPPPHHQDGNGSNLQNNGHHDNFTQTSHQNQQPYSNTSFSYPGGATNMSGQGPAVLYPPSNFVPNANSGHSNASNPPVTLPTGFLPDLSGSNTFTGAIIPSDSNNSLIFPPSIMKGVSTSRNNGGRHNASYLQSTTSTSSHHHHHQASQQLPARNDNSSTQVTETNRNSNANMTSNDVSSTRRLGSHSTGLPLHHQTNNLASSNNGNCSLTKSRGNGSRRRIPDPIVSASTSTTGITGLVDLGYLPMPPGIGSPMLAADDATFLGHHTSGTFLAPPGPQLYPAGPAPTPQGTLYPPPPRPPTQTPSQANHHSGSHLPPFSSCAPVQQNASLTRASHQQQQANASPNATNTSGNTLANFNLSTIFPEINDKQVPSVSSVVGFASETKNLTPASSSLLPPANTSHHHSTILPPGSSEPEYPRVVPPPTTVHSNCLPPPPVPLHTNFNNILSHAPPQVGRMQWP
ncbi:serine-rich adhesin for platelets-like [Periplaneta americana]|uniref:serine-rich adhesin for platelets-like n=1 Tax=Periplaneta americana TaxID=6978 RepID=UPI0037E7F7DD